MLNTEVAQCVNETLAGASVLCVNTCLATSGNQSLSSRWPRPGLNYRRPDVQEIFTTIEAITKMAKLSKGMTALPSVSLEFGHDLKDAAVRRQVLASLKTHKPLLVILAFPCTLWSRLQQCRRSDSAWKLEDLRADERQLLDFVRVVCEFQRRHGGLYLLENPRTSLAWNEQDIKAVLDLPETEMVYADMCQFGLKDVHGVLHKKATAFALSLIHI